MPINHQNGDPGGCALCDSLLLALKALDPSVVRHAASSTCSFRADHHASFAFAYHFKNDPHLKIYFRAAPSGKADHPPGVLISRRRTVGSEWAKLFPESLRLDGQGQIEPVAAFLFDNSYQLAEARKRSRQRGHPPDYVPPEELLTRDTLPSLALKVAVQQLGWAPDGLQTSAIEEILAALPEFRHLDETTREALVKARLGQGVFRRQLIERDGACAVTSCSVLKALVAAHIKPWAVCDNRERLDHSNGLLLVGTLDRLFDAGLITFTEDGEMRISKVISRDEQAHLGLKSEMRLRKIIPGSEVYLRWHREHRFHGGAA